MKIQLKEYLPRQKKAIYYIHYNLEKSESIYNREKQIYLSNKLRNVKSQIKINTIKENVENEIDKFIHFKIMMIIDDYNHIQILSIKNEMKQDIINYLQKFNNDNYTVNELLMQEIKN